MTVTHAEGVLRLRGFRGRYRVSAAASSPTAAATELMLIRGSGEQIELVLPHGCGTRHRIVPAYHPKRTFDDFPPAAQRKRCPMTLLTPTRPAL